MVQQGSFHHQSQRWYATEMLVVNCDTRTAVLVQQSVNRDPLLQH